jgi:hypothetical protein
MRFRGDGPGQAAEFARQRVRQRRLGEAETLGQFLGAASGRTGIRFFAAVFAAARWTAGARSGYPSGGPDRLLGKALRDLGRGRFSG